MTQVFQAVGVVALVTPFIAALIAGAAIANGFMVYLFWGWFIHPVFSGAPNLTLAQSIGLAAIVAVLVKSGSRESKKSKDQSNGEAIAEFLITYGAMLLFGWIVHLFV
ncbi:hypothetical protein NDA01_21550 [Trichocoleus desertorum AS-A10]|uniref:hypothetical protein n=1 Tax=Trichocoleus desertorum TaxID=1481672 RepID=UPI003298E90B